MTCSHGRSFNPNANPPSSGLPLTGAVASPPAAASRRPHAAAIIPPPDIRAALRQATHQAHARLHAQPHFAALLRGTLSRPAYAALLLRLLGLHAPIEAGLARHAGSRWLAWAETTPDQTRAARLARDLRALGLDAAAIVAAPMADALLPSLTHPAAALGCAWVVEGSALGGVVLARRLAAAPALAGSGSFFQPAEGHAGDRQALRWRACCRALDECGAAPDRWVAMRDAAQATFDAFETWLGPVA
jgi:heme oxygenase